MNGVLAGRKKCKGNRYLFLTSVCSCLFSYCPPPHNSSFRPSSRYLLCEAHWASLDTAALSLFWPPLCSESQDRLNSRSTTSSPAPPLSGSFLRKDLVWSCLYSQHLIHFLSHAERLKTMLVACSWRLPMKCPLLSTGLGVQPNPRVINTRKVKLYRLNKL